MDAPNTPNAPKSPSPRNHLEDPQPIQTDNNNKNRQVQTSSDTGMTALPSEQNESLDAKERLQRFDLVIQHLHRLRATLALDSSVRELQKLQTLNILGQNLLPPPPHPVPPHGVGNRPQVPPPVQQNLHQGSRPPHLPPPGLLMPPGCAPPHPPTGNFMGIRGMGPGVFEGLRPPPGLGVPPLQHKMPFMPPREWGSNGLSAQEISPRAR